MPEPPGDVVGARVLALLGDSVTTDHISPVGAIPEDSPAGRYLIEHGVERRDFNSYGSRRGNHDVMVRGTFANVRLRNLLVDREGGWTRHFPDGEEPPIFDAQGPAVQEPIGSGQGGYRLGHQRLPLLVNPRQAAVPRRRRRRRRSPRSDPGVGAAGT